MGWLTGISDSSLVLTCRLSPKRLRSRAQIVTEVRPGNVRRAPPAISKSVSRCPPGMKKGRSGALDESLVSYDFFNEIGPERVSRAPLE